MTHRTDSRHNASSRPKTISRRRVLQALGGMGVGTVVFQRALAAQVVETGTVTSHMIEEAEWISGLKLSEEDRQATADAVNRTIDNLTEIRSVDVGYDVPPALSFHALPNQAAAPTSRRGPIEMTEGAAPHRPASNEDVAFLPVTELAALLRTRQITSVELTTIYLKRLKKYDPALHCVVTLTEELALRQAEKADREISAGRYRGPLHGVPWGAKDLIAYPGYKTTWGATPFKDQVLDTKATVAGRLDEAGAVLIAKLSLGALAWGDKWFGGMTRNPWDVRQGSSGSSAGSASATAAGLVGFTLGSETLGSIISPCRRCGTTGLRPTFGRVSRHGCMTLAWSMDKIGPITRGVEDCALVLAAIHGHDGLDSTAVDRPFYWPARRDLRTMKVGYFEGRTPVEKRPELKLLGELGVKLLPIKLTPLDKFPVWPLTLILNVEASTVFDKLTREGVTEGLGRWPGVFRHHQFISAVDYLRANRVRTLVMREMEQVMRNIDAYVGGNDLGITNLTGHPTVVLPAGFTRRNDATVPRSITLTGKLFGESELLSIAHAYQQATDFHLRRPPMEKLAAAADEE